MSEDPAFTSRRPTTAASEQSIDSRSFGGGTRPTSRRANGVPSFPRDRPESRMGEQSRPMSRIARLQSASRPATSLRQGSAHRVTTARPPTASTSGIPAHAHVNLMNRPVTQQGVSGLRTATRTSYGNRRMVHDKTYFVGIVHTKMGEISSEMQKLQGQIETLAQEHSTFLTYEKRVKELAIELSEMQGQFTDYNLLSDVIVSGKGKSHVEEELKQIVRENKLLSQKIETIFIRRRETEKQVRDLEGKIEAEKTKSNRLVETLSEPMREKYNAIREENLRLQEEMMILQGQFDDLTCRRDEMYAKICNSELSRRAAALELEYIEVSGKRDELLRETSSRETPEEERDRLLQQVKVNNAEIATLERQITELHDELRLAENELKALDQEIEESDSERQQKFRELKKKEDEIDFFMKTFEDDKAKELEGINNLELEVSNVMEKITRNYQLSSALPEGVIASQSFAELEDDFQLKVDESDKAKFTTELIEVRNEALKKQLEEFENLEEKLEIELKGLEGRMEEMKTEMVKFQDIDRAKAEASEKTIRLQKEKKLWEEKLKHVGELLKTTKAEHDNIEADLLGNEVYIQIKSLEKKWITLEQNNFELSSYIKVKQSETNFEDVKIKALQLLTDYNGLLQNRFLM